MSKLRGVVRFGAAVCVAGLSVAGPLALGVAAADSSGTGSAEAGAGSGSGAARPAPAKQSKIGRGVGADGPSSRVGRVPAPVAAGEVGEVRRTRIPAARVGAADDRAPAGGAPADVVEVSRSASSVVGPGRVNETPSMPAGQQPSGPGPDARPVVAAPVGADPASAVVGVEVPGLVGPVRPAAGAVAAIPAGLQIAIPAVSQVPSTMQSFLERAFAPLIVGIERAFDAAGQWLASFPPNPVTDFLAGTVWLVRRTLFPVGDGVGLWGSAQCVSTGDCSGQDLSGADLRGQDLTGVRFTNANLNRAILGAANLTSADFSGATVLQADLTNANLTGANLSGVDLKGQNLLGVSLTNANLTNANLTGARLWGRPTTDLATATLVGANFTGQTFSSANGTTLNWAGKDLTGVILTGANLTGADLSRANLTGAELNGVNLTRANLTDATLPGPSFASPLVFATLTGANLTNVDLSGADLSRMNLTGTILAGANLARTNLKWANLTDANLVNATLTGADLTGADLTRADLLGADMLNTTLTGVTWKDTRCSYGNKTSAGCSNAPLPAEPPADWLKTASEQKVPWQWYLYDGPGSVPDYERKTTPTLRGTPGAPLQNASWDHFSGYPDDGVQGMIYNDSAERIVVRTWFQVDGGDFYCCSTAILDPGDSVSYQFAEDYIDDELMGHGGDLQLLRYDNGQAVGDPANLWLTDFNVSQPATEFTPPGYKDPVNKREDWKEEEQHSEIWGGINISVKREIDGWRVKGSDTFNKYYQNPNDDATNDWAIFTIRVKSL